MVLDVSIQGCTNPGRQVAVVAKFCTVPHNICGSSVWRGTAVAQWLRCCATNRKVAGSIPDGVIGSFH